MAPYRLCNFTRTHYRPLRAVNAPNATLQSRLRRTFAPERAFLLLIDIPPSLSPDILRQISEGYASYPDILRQNSEGYSTSPDILRQNSEGYASYPDILRQISEGYDTPPDILRQISEGYATYLDILRQNSEGYDTLPDILRRFAEGCGRRTGRGHRRLAIRDSAAGRSGGP